MQGTYTNICRACRMDANMTQEEWAEELNVSVESVKGWEGNLRIPSNQMVARMVERCGNLFWAYKHLTQVGAVLGCLPDVEQNPLPIAAIKIVNRVVEFAERHRDRDLMKMAEDGVIDETEKPLYDQIMEELEGLVTAAISLKYAEIKNDRPDGGTPGRSALKADKT